MNDIPFKIEFPLPVDYKGTHLDCGYRLDLLVADDLNAGRLVRPFARGIRSDYHYYFVCSPERIDAPEIQTFLEKVGDLEHGPTGAQVHDEYLNNARALQLVDNGRVRHAREDRGIASPR